MCGDAAMPNLILCTTMWDDVDPQIGEARQKELCDTEMFFGGMLKKGAQTARLDNTLEKAQALIYQTLKLTPIALRIQREIVDEHKALGDTAAGSRVNEEITKLERKRRAELQEAEEEMKVAIAEKDLEMQKELEADRRAYAEQLEKMEKQRFILAQAQQIDELRRQIANLEAGNRRQDWWTWLKGVGCTLFSTPLVYQHQPRRRDFHHR